MWYFTWILGLGFAVLLAVVNTLWHDAHENADTGHTN
ncbi:MAG: cytochrome bd-I oxidase subunit CydX [Rhodocyclaceae bacterium]|jgi:cyd operon protein YbgT|nr:cytochrome bd-I oxidase subunit CydX [Rhodocyclaceae bacterium]